MAYQEWKKLVRGKIIPRLKAKGITVISSIVGDFLGQDRFSREKLVEESKELLNAKTREEVLMEAADVADWFGQVLAVNKISPEELARARAEKTAKNGEVGFEYLESTDEPDAPNGQPK